MSRNRRNVRRHKITDYLSTKTFLMIVAVLLAIIIVCILINEYKRNEDIKLLAKQKEEIDNMSEQIFVEIGDNISQTNKEILEKNEVIKMSAVGDILCGEAMIKDAYDEEYESYDFTHMFRRVAGYINKADIIMGTMETNFTDGDYTEENAPKEFAKAAKQTGINLVTISHNHSLDKGLKGLKDTKKYLKDMGYDVVGDKLEDEHAVLIRKIKDVNIAFLTYTYGVNSQSSKSKEELDAVSIYSEKQVKSDIKYTKEKGADYICVLIHWGEAISGEISKQQKQMADFLVDSGVDLILGAHPSVVQPMEVRKNKEGKNVFIAYSIGTYISTLADENAKVELVLNIELVKSGKDGKVYLNKVDYTPIYVLDNGRNSQNRYELIDMKSTASSYASGNTDIVDRNTYNRLVKGLKRLDSILTD